MPIKIGEKMGQRENQARGEEAKGELTAAPVVGWRLRLQGWSRHWGVERLGDASGVSVAGGRGRG